MTNDNKPVEGYDVITNGWRKDMGWCVIRPGECVANVPEACICKQMPPHVWEAMHKRTYGEHKP